MGQCFWARPLSPLSAARQPCYLHPCAKQALDGTVGGTILGEGLFLSIWHRSKAQVCMGEGQGSQQKSNNGLLGLVIAWHLRASRFQLFQLVTRSQEMPSLSVITPNNKYLFINYTQPVPPSTRLSRAEIRATQPTNHQNSCESKPRTTHQAMSPMQPSSNSTRKNLQHARNDEDQGKVSKCFRSVVSYKNRETVPRL